MSIYQVFVVVHRGASDHVIGCELYQNEQKAAIKAEEYSRKRKLFNEKIINVFVEQIH